MCLIGEGELMSSGSKWKMLYFRGRGTSLGINVDVIINTFELEALLWDSGRCEVRASASPDRRHATWLPGRYDVTHRQVTDSSSRSRSGLVMRDRAYENQQDAASVDATVTSATFRNSLNEISFEVYTKYQCFLSLTVCPNMCYCNFTFSLSNCHCISLSYNCSIVFHCLTCICSLYLIFTARCYACAVLAMGLCLSVCHKSVFY